MTIPRATMRLQFHRGFKFADACQIVPYIEALHISHVYASPILKARVGSMHGYDVVDPTEINPELGGEDDFRTFVAALRAHSLGLIVDIVPNHMAAGDENPWWRDVLQHGQSSPYAKFFDIDWQAPGLDGKILLPVLGDIYTKVLAKGDIALVEENDSYHIKYFKHRFPIRPEDDANIKSLTSDDFDPTTVSGRLRLHTLLEQQHYRLAWWKNANDAINWRRFFDINELVALRCEDEEVFETTHRKLFKLYSEGLIDGVRVDHIDGLTDPQNYCLELRSRFQALNAQRPAALRTNAYIVVEKILGTAEHLPADWQIDGTTGYDFMDQVARMLHDPRGGEPLAQLWHKVSGRPAEFSKEEDIARWEILARSFGAQLESLVGTLLALSRSDLATRDLAAPAIRRVVIEILVHMRVYRTYARVGQASKADERHLLQAIAAALKSCLPSDRETLCIVATWLGEIQGQGDATLHAEALRKFQQLSAPLAAKAVEDTAFYRYGVLLSRLDVGFDPSRFGDTVGKFHDKMQSRMSHVPHAMLATATHDHKRGEDVRARLAVLSQIPEIWAQTLDLWLEESQPLFMDLNGKQAPSKGDAAILFQMIVGAWPLDLVWDDAGGCEAFHERLAVWQQKALREAKLHTDWSAPNEAYEKAARDFLSGMFNPQWREKIAAFVLRIAAPSALKSLTQTLLKLTCPGVPDIYQGTEFWDFSLVDPDNRRPVNFAARVHALSQGDEFGTLVQNWRDARIKQRIIARVLEARQQQAAVFEQGNYVPISVEGPRADDLITFARQQGSTTALVVAPRLSSALLDQDNIIVPPAFWGNTVLRIPPQFERRSWRNVLNGKTTSEPIISVASALSDSPVAIFISADS